MGAPTFSNPKEKIQVIAWMDDNLNWQTDNSVSLNDYDDLVLLSVSFTGDLFYAFHSGNRYGGRLFKGRWNRGVM